MQRASLNKHNKSDENILKARNVIKLHWYKQWRYSSFIWQQKCCQSYKFKLWISFKSARRNKRHQNERRKHNNSFRMQRFIEHDFSKETRQCKLFNDISSTFDQIKFKHFEKRRQFERKRTEIKHKHKKPIHIIKIILCNRRIVTVIHKEHKRSYITRSLWKDIFFEKTSHFNGIIKLISSNEFKWKKTIMIKKSQRKIRRYNYISNSQNEIQISFNDNNIFNIFQLLTKAYTLKIKNNRTINDRTKHRD